MSRVLYVGELTPFSRSSQRLAALEQLGFTVDGISWAAPALGGPEDLPPTLLDRVARRLGRPRDRYGVNEQVRQALAERHYRMLWVDKAPPLRPETLAFARGCRPGIRLVFNSDDDMFARHNRSRFFVRGLPLYDAVLTPKHYNAAPEELPALGARLCLPYHQGFDPRFHRPVRVSHADRRRFGAPVGFIGTFEEPRARTLLGLAERGLTLRVFGNGWEGLRGAHPRLRIEGRAVYGHDYLKVLAATDLNLAFLRKANRDTHTSRSLDIPACGAFMLGERTEEHRALFAEDREAAYFSSDEELLEKALHWLDHAEERRRVARAGRRRCIRSGYSHAAILGGLLEAAGIAA